VFMVWNTLWYAIVQQSGARVFMERQRFVVWNYSTLNLSNVCFPSQQCGRRAGQQTLR